MGRGLPVNLRRLRVALAGAGTSWLADRPASSRPALIGSLVMRALAAVAALVAVRSVALPVLRAPAPADLPGDGPNGARFGLGEERRHEIFREIVAGEPAARARAAQAFPGDAWSTEDDRAAFERDTVRALAQRSQLSLSQVYLVLDEGIRDHWPGPDGKPVSAQSYPLAPRKR
jgi:hypothetical protein